MSPKTQPELMSPPDLPPAKLLDRLPAAIRAEDAYPGWAKRFILFHNKRHPETLGAFLTHLAVRSPLD